MTPDLTFDVCFDAVVGAEGGYVNDPLDPGGETKYGISKRAYPHLNIKNLSIDIARTIYFTDYWTAVNAGALPSPLNLFVFDAAVNQGVHTAATMLQRLIRTRADGVIGEQTVAAVRMHEVRELTALYLADRIERYERVRQYPRYGRGWKKRLFLLALRVPISTTGSNTDKTT